LARTPPGSTRAVYDLRELEVAGLANPPAMFVRRNGRGLELRESDELVRMVSPVSSADIAKAFKAIEGLRDGECHRFTVWYVAPPGVSRWAEVACRVLQRDGDGTVRLFLADFQVVERDQAAIPHSRARLI
jgi:hypothetical protein